MMDQWNQIFLTVLNMSLTASIVIAAVLVLRLLLKRAPKIFSYCLWAAVLFRLLCPVSFTASFSPFSILQPASADSGKLEYIPDDFTRYPQTGTQPAAKEQTQQQETVQAAAVYTEASSISDRTFLTNTGSILWLLGMAVILLYNLLSMRKLKRSLKSADLIRDNIYTAKTITTPFVMGFFRPRIYLPAHLHTGEQTYILLHEQIHLKRLDHITKLLSWLALCLHWFNPLVWLAFYLSTKDMEMSCDEAVIRKMGSSIKKEYSSFLLSMASGTSLISGAPLAFGTGDTGSRIKNILHYQKPTACVIKGAALFCAIALAVLLANPDIDAEARKNKGAAISSAQNTSSETSKHAPSKQSEEKSNQKKTSEKTEEQPLLPAASNLNSADEKARLYLPDDAVKPGRSFYELSIRSISENGSAIDSYIPPFDSSFKGNGALSIAKNCRYFINYSMNGPDYREVSSDTFARYIKKGGTMLDKHCLLGFEENQIVYAALESAWVHYGISPSWQVPSNGLFDSITASKSEAAFYKKYFLVSSETLDVSDSPGEETIEVYTDKRKNADICIILIKRTDGSILYKQDAVTSRAGWNNIYLGSAGGHPFILNLQLDDRYNFSQISYQAYQLNKDGQPMLAAASSFVFEFTQGSSIIYDDAVFRTWIQPLEYYLKNSYLTASSQNGTIRTKRISEADKYNYETLNFKKRILEITASDQGISDAFLSYDNCWYPKNCLEQETINWLLRYQNLPEKHPETLDAPPELFEARQLMEESGR